MAERIQVDLVDDIDGSPAQHTVTFALDGVTYEIDLNDGHAKQLRAVFDRYIKASRSPKPETPRTTKQQERAEEQAREENKQLTEQIRGAAQRTRDRLKVQEPVRTDADQETEELPPTPEPALVSGANGSTEADRDAEEAPAVSLPLFSSAVD